MISMLLSYVLINSYVSENTWTYEANVLHAEGKLVYI